MILIVGLGNPGEKYEKTRHNIGFRAVDEIAANFQFPLIAGQLQGGGKRRLVCLFKFQKIFNAQISKGEISGKETILAKPQTFMNLSGKSVKILTKTYNLEPENIIIVHDDIDLPLGKIKIATGRGAAGHKGVESIIKALGTKNFVRFRIGILPKSGKPKNPEKFVLQNFNKEEEKIINEVIKKSAEAVETILKEGLEKTMNKYNK